MLLIPYCTLSHNINYILLHVYVLIYRTAKSGKCPGILNWNRSNIEHVKKCPINYGNRHAHFWGENYAALLNNYDRSVESVV